MSNKNIFNLSYNQSNPNINSLIAKTFDAITKDDIRVGYIDPIQGYVINVTVCEANNYAQKNPGTRFIFRDGDNNIRYLNINQVNQLTADDLKPKKQCSGLQTPRRCDVPPTIQFLGGGGVGALANPVIGADGSLLAIDLIKGGYGYQYPPQIKVVDACKIGSGAVARAELGSIVDVEEVYEQDLEEYEICTPEDSIAYETIYGPNGEDLGIWDPEIYTNIDQDDAVVTVENYQQLLLKLKNPFWTTRKSRPFRITSTDKNSYIQAYNVTYPAWNEFMNSHAVSPVSPSNVPGSDNAGKLFIMEWDIDFPFDGEYVFRGLCDNKAKLYVDNLLVSDLRSFNDAVTPINKIIKKGIHNIRVDLLNSIEDPKTISRNVQLETKEIKVEVPIEGWNGDGVYLDLSNLSGDIDVTFSISARGSDLYHGITFAGVGTIEKSLGTNTKKYKLKGGRIYGPCTPTTPRGLNGEQTRIFAGDERPTDVRNVTNRPANEIVVEEGRDDWNDFVVSVNNGVFKRFKTQPKTVKTVSQEIPRPNAQIIRNSKVFNTVDYISKANRQLWRINPNAGPGSGFINEYGILPFDPNSAEAQRNSFVGTHTIVWNNVNFPVDGNYNIRIAVDDNVTLYIGDTVIRKEGFFPGTSTAIPDLDRKYSFKAGNYTIRAELEQINVGPLSKGNPMALAIDITTTFATVTTKSLKSWNENPMGVALTIDAPEPPVPQQKLPVQEGKCPPNPIWSTRFPGAREQWYPVRYTKNNSWSRFMNKYAISPVKPLDTPGSDKAGITYKNSWTVDIPYSGYYGVKGTRDNTGRLLIDGKEISKLDGFNNNSPKTTKVYLTKGSHIIDVEVYNTPQGTSNIVDQKIFSTKDWQTRLQATQQVQNVQSPVQTEEWVFSEDVFDPPRTYHQYLSGTWYRGTRYRAYGDWNNTNPYTNFIQVDDNTRIVLGSYKNGPFGIAVYKKVTKTSTQTTQVLTQAKSIDNANYSGPPLFNYKIKEWSDFMNNYSVSPKVFDNITQPDESVVGKYTLTWKKISFPYDGTYKINFQADSVGVLKIGGKQITRVTNFEGQPVQYTTELSKGVYDVTIEVDNLGDPQYLKTIGANPYVFSTNPMGVALYITKDVDVGDLNQKTWYDNPIGISAILIPPPCRKKINGRGVISKVIVTTPGNGYTPPSTQSSEGYPATLQLTDIVITNPGINYNCGVDQIKIIPDNGAKLSYTCDPFGIITKVNVDVPGIGFTEYPTIYMDTETGVNFSAVPVFDVIRDPIGIATDRLIQVTDLVGLKQTGYVNGRPYYGAVYYENGIRYAGYYETIGTPIQVYDTLQESIDAQITTPPSAIQRSGTDVNSNNPNLNIPGTIQDTTTQE